MAELRLFLYVLLGTEYPRTPAHPDYHEQPDVKVQHHSTVSAEETFYKTPCRSNVMFKFLVLPCTSSHANAVHTILELGIGSFVRIIYGQSLSCLEQKRRKSKADRRNRLHVQRSKQYHRKVLPSSFCLNGQTLGFHPQTQKLEPPCTA